MIESIRLRGLTLLLASFAALAMGASIEPGFDPWNDAAIYQIEYEVDLSVLADASEWRVWVPLPADNAVQRVVESQLETPGVHRVTEDARGNRYLYLEGSGRPSAPIVTRHTIERAPTGSSGADAAQPGTIDDPKRYLSAQKRIPLDGMIAQISDQESRDIGSDRAKIRAFYDYVLKNMRYAKHGKGWGQGDAIWACSEKYGNCTDFHSLFIGLARQQSIPARFVIGFPVSAAEKQRAVAGYHCWAEFFEADEGWVPLDASEAWKSGRNDAYFGFLPSDRIEFSTGRDLVLEPPQQGPARNYFIYPYAEANGEPIDKLPFEFRYERKATTPSSRS